MQLTVKTTALAVVAVVAVLAGTAGVAWAAPAVSNVAMTQIADTRMVEVTYDLGGEDAIVTLSIETNGVAITNSAIKWVSGDVCKLVAQGTGKSILWNATADWPENVTAAAKARVTAWRIDAPPPVMVIDLSGGTNALTYPVAYYTSVEALPGGVTNTIYKSAYLVMRMITNGTFKMQGSQNVTLTQNFYTGVYQVTQGQWFNVMGSELGASAGNESIRAFRPMEKVSYNDVRGATNSVPSVNWPITGSSVSPTNFLGQLRAKTGIVDLDLPTEAQWEYACRAGTTTYYNDGIAGTPNSTSNTQIDVLGRYKHNGGSSDGTAIVGSYLPNTWGLYDMHGNVFEWCRDWYGTLDYATNSVGPVSSSENKRVKRGGNYNSLSEYCRTAYRDKTLPDTRDTTIGFRIVRTLP